MANFPGFQPGRPLMTPEEKRLSQPTPPGRVVRGNGWRLLVRADFLADFPADRFATYEQFIAARGEVIKTERRSRVTLLRGTGAGSPADPPRVFVLKEYRYTGARSIRTLFRTSRGEREMENLLHLHAVGVPAVEPVACGVTRDPLGMVRSTFVITRHLEGCLDLRGWQSAQGLAPAFFQKRRDLVLREVGRLLRRIHESGFFLFTPKASNILIRPGDDMPPEIVFLDLPRAGRIRTGFLRGFAQARDLGTFLMDFPREGGPSDWEPFFEAYLPDPLGGAPDALRRRVAREVRAQRNLTPLTATVDRFKRRVREASRGPSDGATTGTRRQPSRRE